MGMLSSLKITLERMIVPAAIANREDQNSNRIIFSNTGARKLLGFNDKSENTYLRSLVKFNDPKNHESSSEWLEAKTLHGNNTIQVNVTKLQDEDEVYYLLIFRDISSENAKEEELKRIANNAKKENDELASQLLKEKRLKSQMALLTKIYKATVGLIIMLGALIGLSWVFPKENSTESLAMIERILLVITGILGSATASMFDSKNQSNNEDQ